MIEEEECSEREFYFPNELEFSGQSDLTETNYERVGERERNSQEVIEIFVKEQKSETKKTVSYMRTFQRYLSSMSKGDVEVLDLSSPDLCGWKR